MQATESTWRQAVADRPGQCIVCGKPISAGQSVGFRKSGALEGAGPAWVRAHENCIPAQERTQTAFPGPLPVVDVPKGLQASESMETALLSIADSLNRLAKESMRRNDLLEAIEFLMRK